MRIIALLRGKCALLALAVLLSIPGPGSGWAAPADMPPRLAVVIGNGDYASSRLPDLPNASRDAAVLSRLLVGLGFEVIHADDAAASRLSEILARAKAREPSEALLVFYAGHAVEADGDMLLLPVDSSDPTSIGRLRAQATSLSALVAQLARPDRPTLIFVDTCRSEAASEAKPLMPLPDNVFLAFATQPGADAADGAARNSPFTRALLRTLAWPEAGLSVLMERVGAETSRLTLGRQRPWSRSTLRQEFFFRARGAAARPGG